MKKGYHLPKPNKMKVLLKQTVGIDVAQNELVVSLGRMDELISIEVYAYKVFPNTKRDFPALYRGLISKHSLVLRYGM